jgi:hypothetical protein
LRILLVHPEDSLRSGPWLGQNWDLVVDLGKSSAFIRDLSQERLKAPVLQLDSLLQAEDIELMRKIVGLGRDQLMDDAGLDWWVLVSVFVYAPLGEAVMLRRLVSQLAPAAELYATRPGWPASGVALMLERPLRTFPDAHRPSKFHHYRGVLKRFSLDQIAQIFLDKYDPRYRWRRRFFESRPERRGPVVLLPSAYTNVSQMAVAYASMLPEQSFLVVATRRSGTHFAPAPNVACASLAAYADGAESEAEYLRIVGQWEKLKQSFALFPEMNLLLRAGLLERFTAHFRDGLAVRNAWRNVLSQEQVVAVMCGDDSNPSTRLPVMLARQQGIPTLDFHHGAMDGRFTLKELSSDLYLAKGEMERDYLLRICGLPAERVVLGGPVRSRAVPAGEGKKDEDSVIIFFSEPYDSGGRRTEEVYQELLPPLALLAREHGRRLVVKLHPFESRHERMQLIGKVLSPAEAGWVDVVEGPFTPQLVAKAWFAITVESSTVIDCALLGVTCFVCDWMNSSSYGYNHQYARFGVGKPLNSREQLKELPRLLTKPATQVSDDALSKPLEPEWLRQIISNGGNAKASHMPGHEKAGAQNTE